MSVSSTALAAMPAGGPYRYVPYHTASPNITAKWKVALLGIPVVIVAAIVLANPSEDRHLDQFVRKAQAWEDAHVESCDVCDSVTDAEELRRMAVSSFDERGILIGGGLRRKNYIFFSVLTHKGLTDARTFGFLGCVFGPTFTAPWPCPKQNTIVVLEPRDVSEFDSTFTFSLLADGSLSHNGEPVTREELKSRLDAITEKDATAIVIEVDRDAPSAEFSEMLDWASSLGFGAVQATTAAEANQ